MKKTAFALFLFLMLLLASCSHSFNSTLSDANLIMEAAPDSALTLLGEIDTTSLQSESDRAFYHLLSTQARVKCDVPVTSDSLISASAAFFSQNGPDSLAMRALFYQGWVNYELEQYSKSIIPSMKAYNAAVDVNDCYWIAKTAELIGFIYTQSYYGEEALSYYVKAAVNYKRAGKVLNHQYSLIDVANNYIERSDFNGCVNLVDSILDVELCKGADVIDSIFVVECYKLLRDAHFYNKNIDKANEYNLLLSEILHESDYGIDDISANALLQIARCGSENVLSNYLMQVPASLSLQGKAKYYFVLLSAARDAEDLNGIVAYSDSLVLMSDSILRQNMRQSVITAQRDEFNKMVIEERVVSENLLMLLVLIGFVSVVIITLMILYYRARMNLKNAEIEKQLEDILELSQTLKVTKDANVGLNTRLNEANAILDKQRVEKSQFSDNAGSKNLYGHIENLFKEKWDLLSVLSREYFENDGNLQTRPYLLKQIKREFQNLKTQDKIDSIVDAVNLYMCGIIDCIKEECPFIKKEDIPLIALCISGFPSKAICLILEMKLATFYSKKSRIISRINNSNACHKSVFISHIRQSAD